ncbi:MAG: arginase [Balneolaceae bacterium]|nr:MAG: arginase [Balneolaceae bacterium]
MSADPRLRDFINRKSSEQSRVHLLQFPSDHGILTNNGRPGAAQAPDLIRARLFNLTPHPSYYQKHTDLLEKVYDAGIVPCSENVENDQRLLGMEVAKILGKNRIPIILGGGHETSFGHFLGYVNTGRPVTIINIDSHADVRMLKDEKPHSGSPFRQALEHDSATCKGYHVFGLNPSTVSFPHYNFVKKRGSALYEGEISKEIILNHIEDIEGDLMITMDIDAVNQGEAPGVSAPNPSGIRKDLWLQLAYEFGRNEKVTSFDLCEVNPVYDQDLRTVRLAALTVWYFLLGLSMRIR